MSEPRFRLLGGPGSPYSLKMRAVLRYRRIAHDWIVPPGYLGGSGELKLAGKRMIPVMQLPDQRYWADTTPMIQALEKLHSGRSVLPEDPADRFLALLVEEFADEWLVMPMFDYRWDAELDQAFCARRQMAGWLGAMPAAEFDAIIARFRDRQTKVLAAMGDRETNRPVLRATYRLVLAAVETQLGSTRYFFGGRPSVGDFALFGQLSQCAIDPSASAIMRAEAVRTFQWVQDLDDASGIEGAWRDPTAPITPGLAALLRVIGDFFMPFMAANAAAVQPIADLEDTGSSVGRPGHGTATSFTVALPDGVMMATANRYRANCMGWLKQALDEVRGPARDRLEAILRAYGCWDALQFLPGERETIPAMVPR